MKNAVLLLLGPALAVACAVPDPAPDPEPMPAAPPVRAADAPASLGPLALELSEDGREAFERLLVARRFTDDAIYDGGVTPNEVIALRRLWREPEADAALKSLLDRATLPGQLYALCGLYYTDREAFRRRIEPYRGLGGFIEFQSGCCTLVDQPVADLVELPDLQAVRLQGDETAKDWFARQSPEGSYRYDLIGGGWPNLFRTGGGWHVPIDEEYADERD